MKGLLIKDLQLMKNQGRTPAAVLLVVALFLGLSGNDAGFMVAYLTFVISIFAATSISYDEFDNCFPNLLVLPVSRKEYVNEKYVFGAFSILISWVIAFLLGSILQFIKGYAVMSGEWIAECFSYMVVAGVFQALLIPLRLKFEGEKGRVVLPILIAVIGIIVLAAARGAAYLGIDLEQSAVTLLNSIGVAGIVAALVGIAVVGLLISYLCSRKILEKKEF